MPLAWSKLAEQLERPLPLGLGLVGDVDARLDAPEQVGTDRDEAQVGDPGRGVAHRLVDAENLLDQHDDAGRLALRLQQIRRETAGPVAGLDGDARHGAPLAVAASEAPSLADAAPSTQSVYQRSPIRRPLGAASRGVRPPHRRARFRHRVRCRWRHRTGRIVQRGCPLRSRGERSRLGNPRASPCSLIRCPKADFSAIGADNHLVEPRVYFATTAENRRGEDLPLFPRLNSCSYDNAPRARTRTAPREPTKIVNSAMSEQPL